MIRWTFQSNDKQIGRQMAIKSLTAGVVLIGLGMLIIAFPELVSIPLAILFFLIGFFCLTSAWRLFWFSRGSGGPNPNDPSYEDAQFREIP